MIPSVSGSAAPSDPVSSEVAAAAAEREGAEGENGGRELGAVHGDAGLPRPELLGKPNLRAWPRLGSQCRSPIGALAAASLAAPFAPVYDPWAWLVWGRELAGFDLDTSAGPSWKPLPALITTLFAPAGDAAPALWLFVARAGWLAAAALAYRLAWRLMFPVRVATRLARCASRLSRVRLARNLAGALAAIGVLLLVRPVHVVVAPVRRRPLRAAAGGAGARRDRPRALRTPRPGAGAGVRGGAAAPRGLAAARRLRDLWLWRRDRDLRPWLVAAALALPALWLVARPDRLGRRRSPGPSRAREGTGSPPHELVESIGRSLALPLAGLWAGVAVAVATARHHREDEILALAYGAAAWIAIVAVLAAVGYAGLPRFAAPAAAIACILGGIGFVRLLAAIDGMRAGDRLRPVAQGLAGAIVAVLVIQGAVRVAEIPGELESAARFGEGVDEIGDLVEEGGRERLTPARRSPRTISSPRRRSPGGSRFRSRRSTCG